MIKIWLRLARPIAILMVLFSAASCQQSSHNKPKNIIIMISDGTGPSAITLARLINQYEPFALDEHLVGTRQTYSLNKFVTDSAAAATAMSTGQLTNNDYVGVDAKYQPIGNVFEAAKFQKNKAVGLVVKSRITHATPAGFSSHVRHRDDEDLIALQQLEFGVDLMFGGGADQYTPKSQDGRRNDERDLFLEAQGKGYHIIRTADQLNGNLKLPLVGLFSEEAMKYEIDRHTTKEPSLKQMTRKALDLLSTSKDGFVIMIEGSEIDHTAHNNDGAALAPEVLSYDAAFAAAIEFARKDGNTLVVSTSDHATGGVTILGGDRDNPRNGPRRLHTFQASADAMVTMVNEGKDLAEVLKQYADVNVTEKEIEDYDAATPGRPDELQKRRVLAMTKIINSRMGINWSTPEHDGSDVFVYAFGPGMEKFKGAQTVTAMGVAIADLLDLDMEEATREARDRIKGKVSSTTRPATTRPYGTTRPFSTTRPFGTTRPAFPGRSGATTRPAFPGRQGATTRPAFPGRSGATTRPAFPGRSGATTRPVIPTESQD